MSAIDIRPIDEAHRDSLAAIWIPWLSDTMGLTPQAEDLAAMADPADYYGRTGGAAMLAHLDGQIVGGVALRGLGASGFEFCKLVVTDAARGHGAGRALVEACLVFCAERDAPALWLQSFNKLEVAIGLYHRMGFIDAPPPPEMSVLQRTEVIMRRTTAGARLGL